MSELSTIIQLRHGPVSAAASYVDSLPEWVVETWAEWALWSRDRPHQNHRLTLSKCLVDDWHQTKITELLEAYYG
jgi:hypothetical protein